MLTESDEDGAAGAGGAGGAGTLVGFQPRPVTTRTAKKMRREVIDMDRMDKKIEHTSTAAVEKLAVPSQDRNDMAFMAQAEMRRTRYAEMYREPKALEVLKRRGISLDGVRVAGGARTESEGGAASAGGAVMAASGGGGAGVSPAGSAAGADVMRVPRGRESRRVPVRSLPPTPSRTPSPPVPPPPETPPVYNLEEPAIHEMEEVGIESVPSRLPTPGARGIAGVLAIAAALPTPPPVTAAERRHRAAAASRDRLRAAAAARAQATKNGKAGGALRSRVSTTIALDEDMSSSGDGEESCTSSCESGTSSGSSTTTRSATV